MKEVEFMKQRKLTKAISMFVACFITLTAIPFTAQASKGIMEYNGVQYAEGTRSGLVGEGRTTFQIEDFNGEVQSKDWYYHDVELNSVCTIQPYNFDGYMLVCLQAFTLSDGVYWRDEEWDITELLADNYAQSGWGFGYGSPDHNNPDKILTVTPEHPTSFIYGENTKINPIFDEEFTFTLRPDDTLYLLECDMYDPNGEHICSSFDPFFVKNAQDIISAYNATPTNSTVMVNNKEIAFDAYNINDNNYFKLRDLAAALNGTSKQFEVTWDGDKNAINLISNQPYMSVGGELDGVGDVMKCAQECTSEIYLNGEPVELTAYTINDNNYFKLRDIGKLLDFGVFWDESLNTILIDTNRGYTEE